ncbi:MAG: hypothetical protein JSU58_05620 [Dehalococcoidales bacterium]|nr:MAG: hypothetical protein JSU58_05620 [Dehalococcoidales bacterium]
MAKEIILYNLADHVADEEYREYVKNEKGPLLDSLSSVRKFELVKTADLAAGDNPYQYIGILHITSLEEFSQKDAPSQEFQAFMKKWQSMVKDVTILTGEEIY